MPTSSTEAHFHCALRNSHENETSRAPLRRTPRLMPLHLRANSRVLAKDLFSLDWL